MKVRLTQIDGSFEIPNLALMRASHLLKLQGHEVFVNHSVNRTEVDISNNYDLVLGFTIFEWSEKKTKILKSNFQHVELGGTGTGSKRKIEELLGYNGDYKEFDYSAYPNFKLSIGHTQKGCDSKCGFCLVPEFEGRNVPYMEVSEIYREGMPKKVIFIDNDFQNRLDWRGQCEQIINLGLQVAFIQGINVRKLTSEHIEYFKYIQFMDKTFTNKKFYCAWDNELDKKRVMRGVELLVNGTSLTHSNITPYMLTNYDFKTKKGIGKLVDGDWNRLQAMAEIGIRPYCMVWGKDKLPANHELKLFQNWINSHNCFSKNGNGEFKVSKSNFEEYKNYLAIRRKPPKEIITDLSLFSCSY